MPGDGFDPVPGGHTPGRQVLTADTRAALTHADGKTTVEPYATTRMTLLTGLGPMPVRITTETYLGRSDGPVREVIDIGPAAWMFRDPVRVPEHWRDLYVTEGDPSYVKFDTLIHPARGETVPPDWFADPATHWRRVP